MKAHTATFTFSTRGKGTYEITDEVARIVRESGVITGLATVFLQHTSASLVIYENADPSARADLHVFFERPVPEDQPEYTHTDEGPDDMPSHLRMVLTSRAARCSPPPAPWFRRDSPQGQSPQHPDSRRIVFPFHDEVDRFTLRGALRDASIPTDDFLRQIK